MNSQQQLTLDLILRDDATFNNYCVGENDLLFSNLKQTSLGQGEQFIYFYGEQGSGRSHLLQACCHHASEKQIICAYLPMQELVSLQVEVFDGLDNLSLVCIDDVEVIAGLTKWEEALFHLYNKLIQSQTRLIISASTIPSELGLQLADLESRLSFAPCFQIKELTEQDKIFLLQQQAKARGLSLGDEVAEFLIKRLPRDQSALFATLERLDRASLQSQRKLTVPFVKKVLDL